MKSSSRSMVKVSFAPALSVRVPFLTVRPLPLAALTIRYFPGSGRVVAVW